jgi:hypothetical protein
MAEPTTMFDVLLPVIIGGGIAIVGGLIGPPFLHHLQQKAEKKRKRAEKFEELIATLYEHSHWLKEMQNVRLFGAEDKNVMSPLAKVQAISTVYFPDFEDQIRQLDIAADQYDLWGPWRHGKSVSQTILNLLMVLPRRINRTMRNFVHS